MKLQNVSEHVLNQVFNLIKIDTKANKTTISECLNVNRITVHRAIKELKGRKWIKSGKRIGIIETYNILKKD